MRHPDLRFLYETRYGPHVTASRSQVTSSSAPRKKIVRTIFNWMKMLPHHWQAHTRDYSYAASHVRVPLCRPCGVLSLFNRTVARAFIRSIGLCGSGYTAMTAIPNVLFNRPQCALFSGLFFPVLSMVGPGGPGSLVSAFIYSEFIQRGTNILWCYCVHQLCGEQFVFSTHVSSLMFQPSPILRCGYFVLVRFRIHVSVNHVGNLRVADVELVFLKKAVGLP